MGEGGSSRRQFAQGLLALCASAGSLGVTGSTNPGSAPATVERWPAYGEAELHALGFHAAGLDRVERAFADQLRSGLHPGAQLAVYRSAELVMSLAGGVARRNGPVRVDRDTLFVLFSATKAWAASCAHILIERGRLDPDARVADYWPEFGRHGKEAVTVRDALSHRGGYPMQFLPKGDGAIVRSQIENTQLSWQPGTANGYHANHFGHTVEVLVERIDGRPLRQFVQDEIFDPLQLADSYLGFGEPDAGSEAKVAYVYPMEERTPGEQFDFGFDIDNPPVAEWKFVWNRPEVHRMVLPSGGGISTAEDLARFYSMLANGGELGGVRILERSTVERALRRTNRPGEVDKRLLTEVAWGQGFMLGDGAAKEIVGAGPRATSSTFGHPGAGCVFAWGDIDRNLAVAHCTNGNRRLGNAAERAGALGRLIMEALL